LLVGPEGLQSRASGGKGGYIERVAEGACSEEGQKTDPLPLYKGSSHGDLAQDGKMIEN